MVTTNAIDQRIAAFLREKLGGDADKVITYLEEKRFSFNGQIAVASLFAFAQEHGASAETVIAQADKEWARNWMYQHPEICGDADAPGAAGMQNRVSLENIYSALGIPSPARK